MDSERIDWFSECGVEREVRTGFLGRVKASLLRRKRNKARRNSGMDPTELVERHNAAFGINSSEPVAAMRYDMRKKPAESSVDVGSLDFTPTDPENGQVITSGITVSVVSRDPSVPTGAVVVQEVGGRTDETFVGSESTEVPGTDSDFFPDVSQKEGAATEDPEADHEESSEDLFAEVDMGVEAAEFEDARREDIVHYVEQEIIRESRQTSIDDPIFDEGCAAVSAEPLRVRQEKLEVEFETPAYSGDVVADIAEASAAAEAVAEAVTQKLISSPAEAAGIPAPAEALALGAPAEVSVISAPAETVLIASPSVSVPCVRAREMNAANVSAGMYGAAEAEYFESQIAQAESSGDQSVVSVQISQIIGGMLIASRISAGAVMPETVEDVVEETVVIEEAAAEEDLSGLFESVRSRNASNVEVGMYGESEASVFESQIAAVESSDRAADIKQIEVAQILGGMLIASRINAIAVMSEEIDVTEDVNEEVVEVYESVEEEDISAAFEFARSRNMSYAEAGMYGASEAESFECQIAEIEASGASAGLAAVQLSQIMGGMIIAVQASANAVAEPVSEETAVADELPVIEGIQAEEKDISGLFESVRARNASNVETGSYGASEASAFDSQIDSVECAECSAEAKQIQLAQIVGGMLIASRIRAGAAEEPEIADAVQGTAIEEEPAADEKDLSALFESVRARNASFAEAGMYGAQEASAFDSQIATVESSDCSADVKLVEVAQIMGGMLMASRASERMSSPAVEPVVETAETIEATDVVAPAVGVPDTVEPPVAETIEEVETTDVAAPAVEVPAVSAEMDVPAEDVPKSTGVSFRFGQSAYRSAVRGTVVRFVFGSASE